MNSLSCRVFFPPFFLRPLAPPAGKPNSHKKRTKIKEKTPLHFAASGGDIRVVQMLSAYGADMKATDANGWTVLHYAAYWNRLDAIQYALFLQVDPRIPDRDGKTARDWARMNQATEAAEYLDNFTKRM